jgi:hypothetical protein
MNTDRLSTAAASPLSLEAIRSLLGVGRGLVAMIGGVYGRLKSRPCQGPLLGRGNDCKV